MDLTALLANVPAAPLPLPQPAASLPHADRRHLPLAQRFTLRATISAKANYFDLANTRRPPHDLRTALIWLCLCAHDNSVWWTPRTADHRDGEDPAPLPLALDYAAWMHYIHTWQDANFEYTEADEIEALALQVWIGAHQTTVIPEDPGQKKTPHPSPSPTGPSSTPGFSPAAAETQTADTVSFTSCPSATSTPPCMHGSAPTASPPSPEQNPPAGTPRSTPSSPPPPPDGL